MTVPRSAPSGVDLAGGDAGVDRANVPPGMELATVEQLLTTTVAVRRRLDLDRPVPRSVIERCLRLAVHAPSANNVQRWRWIVISDPVKRSKVAELYRIAFQAHTAAIGGSPRSRSRRDAASNRRTLESAQWLSDNLDRVPVHVIPCVAGQPPREADSAAIGEAWQRDGARLFGPEPDRRTRRDAAGFVRNAMYFGSIFPAIWSFQLALRGHGLGSAITLPHLIFQNEVAALLGIPSLVTQVCLLPVAYTRGTEFRPAPRRDPARLTYWDGWS